MDRTSSRTAALLGVLGISMGGVAYVEGCGSDSFTAVSSTDDGGADGAPVVSDSGPITDAGPVIDVDACIRPPNTVAAGETDFCSAFAAISTRCMDCETCRSQNANTCDRLGASLSEPFRRGIVACQDQIKCSEFESQAGMATNPCVTAYISDGGLTMHQVAPFEAYCAHCADGGGGVNGTGDESCREFFAGPDGGGNGFGSLVLAVSDTLADDINAKCTPACDQTLYGLCTLSEFCKSAPVDQCGTGICR